MSCQGRKEAAPVPADKDGSHLPSRMHFPTCQLASSTNLGNSRSLCAPKTSGNHLEVSFQHSNKCSEGGKRVKSGSHDVHAPVVPLRSCAGTPRNFLQQKFLLSQNLCPLLDLTGGSKSQNNGPNS